MPPSFPAAASFSSPLVMPVHVATNTQNRAADQRDDRFQAMLSACVQSDASDIHITSGQATHFRIDDRLVAQPDFAFSPDQVDSILDWLLSPPQLTTFHERHQLDFAFTSQAGTRFRVNVYRSRGQTALAIRRLDDAFGDLNALNLPPQLSELANFPYGLVIVTGPTGSGKSTTLASLVHQINLSRACHIITIEDPIEHLHASRLALVHQREVHVDVADFASALKAALREDPDVLLVGEMRDLETMRAALTASETGHLVFSTLHTGDAASAIGRMVGVFPPDEQGVVRDQLSRVLRAVVSQRLVRRKDSGRVPAIEIMRVNSAIANLIRTGDMRQALSVIQSSADEGMLLLEQSLAILTASNFVAREEAIRWCRDVNIFESRLKQLLGKGRAW